MVGFEASKEIHWEGEYKGIKVYPMKCLLIKGTRLKVIKGNWEYNDIKKKINKALLGKYLWKLWPCLAMLGGIEISDPLLIKQE